MASVYCSLLAFSLPPTRSLRIFSLCFGRALPSGSPAPLNCLDHKKHAVFLSPVYDFPLFHDVRSLSSPSAFPVCFSTPSQRSLPRRFPSPSRLIMTRHSRYFANNFRVPPFFLAFIMLIPVFPWISDLQVFSPCLLPAFVVIETFFPFYPSTVLVEVSIVPP